jgi:hypothetical protein
MSPVRLLVLSFTICCLLTSARGQDSRAQAWIHQMVDLHQHAYAQQYLFDTGYRADRARDYDTAFDKFSRFSIANQDRLQSASSQGERAFRDWLKSELKDLEEIRKQRTRSPTSPVGSQGGGGAKGGPSFSTGVNSNSQFASRPGAGPQEIRIPGQQGGGGARGGPSFSTGVNSNSQFASRPGPQEIRIPGQLDTSGSQGGVRQPTRFNGPISTGHHGH